MQTISDRTFQGDGTQAVGLDLRGKLNVRVTNCQFDGYTKAAILLNDESRDIEILDFTMTNCARGIYKIGRGGSGYLIERGTITTDWLAGLTWDQVKRTPKETGGVSLWRVRSDAIIRAVQVKGYFDGIVLSYWPPRRGYLNSCLIENNLMEDIMDDALEVEGSDLRDTTIRDNVARRVKVGISLISVLRGPLQIEREQYEVSDEGFKVGSDHQENYSEGVVNVEDVRVIARGLDGDGVQCTNGPGYANHTYRDCLFDVDRYIVAHGGYRSRNVKFQDSQFIVHHQRPFAQWDKRKMISTLTQFEALGHRGNTLQRVP